MDNSLRINTLLAVVTSWCAAAAATVGALAVVAVGQGVGAVLGGCTWIGVTLPLARPAWALVNQPSLNFADLGRATGYWFGGSAAALGVAVLGLALIPRPRRIAAELALIQLSWHAAILGVAWQSTVDLRDGHLVRWLALHDLPLALVGLAPVAAAAAALVPALRLLALARRADPQISAGARVATVGLHLVLPSLCWMGLAAVAAGLVPVPALVAAGVPVATTLTVAWLRFPPVETRTLEPPRPASLVTLAVTAVVAALLWLAAGSPTGGGRWRGAVWLAPDHRNNIRPWVEVIRLDRPQRMLDRTSE